MQNEINKYLSIMSMNSMLSDMFGSNAGENTSQQIEQKKAFDSQERNTQLPKTTDNAPFYIERVEHAAGMATMFDFINHHIKKGSVLNVKDDILYFDNAMSSKVLMGKVRPNYYNSSTGQESCKKFNPFLCSYYDFIAHTRWEQAYVWEDKIYLLTSKMEFNSYNVKNIPAYTLAIKVDNLSKFEKWEGENALDIRKIIFKIKTEESYFDENGNELDLEELAGFDPDLIPDSLLNKWATAKEQLVKIPVQTIEETVVEQTIPLTFLTAENAHLIYSANRKKLEYESQKIQNQISLSAEEKTRMARRDNLKLYEFFEISTVNEHQRDYAQDERDFAEKHGIDEKEMGWYDYRDKVKEDFE